MRAAETRCSAAAALAEAACLQLAHYYSAGRGMTAMPDGDRAVMLISTSSGAACLSAAAPAAFWWLASVFVRYLCYKAAKKKSLQRQTAKAGTSQSQPGPFGSQLDRAAES